MIGHDDGVIVGEHETSITGERRHSDVGEADDLSKGIIAGWWRSLSPSRRQRYRNGQRSSWRSMRRWTIRRSRSLHRYRLRPWGWRRREGSRRVGELEPSFQSLSKRLKCAEGLNSQYWNLATTRAINTWVSPLILSLCLRSWFKKYQRWFNNTNWILNIRLHRQCVG